MAQFSTFSSSQIEQQATTDLSLYNCYSCMVVATSRVYESSCGHLGIIVRNIHWIKVMQVLNCCSIEIILTVVVN